MVEIKTITVLMACFNRKEKTLACLNALYENSLSTGWVLEIYLVDDGCTDGTGEAVRLNFPVVTVIQGNGDLFWNGGMHLAFDKALKSNADYFLWMNDDTLVNNMALGNLIDSIDKLMKRDISKFLIVGSTQDEHTGLLTYGGVRRKHGIHPFKFKPVQPSTELLRCDTINGNFVCISRAASEEIGNLDSRYKHAFGDFDYGLRASKKNIPMYVMPGFVGTCSNNSSTGTWQDKSLTFKERLRKRHSNTGVPLSNWVVFCRKHGGMFWPIWAASPYLKMVLESLSSKFRGV